MNSISIRWINLTKAFCHWIEIYSPKKKQQKIPKDWAKKKLIVQQKLKPRAKNPTRLSDHLRGSLKSMRQRRQLKLCVTYSLVSNEKVLGANWTQTRGNPGTVIIYSNAANRLIGTLFKFLFIQLQESLQDSLLIGYCWSSMQHRSRGVPQIIPSRTFSPNINAISTRVPTTVKKDVP